MKRILLTISAVAISAGLTACCADYLPGPPPTTATSITSPTSSRPAPTTHAHATSETPALTEDPAPLPTREQATPDSIWTSTGAGNRCPGTDAFVSDPAHRTWDNLGAEPAYDLSDIPVAEGGTCPAAVCGYGTDSLGNPNPSTGERQTRHACGQGCITDAALCAVEQKINGWAP
ncbi:hypothetical protein [Corynebacterium pacaense]|uniref:hypothetical protein n=1 Tax=Corynebacterium pacaense TaxID=1816684 RepID=UPI0009BA277F|nr:hypothetical protein [Corynebacterium pacaense]